MTKCLIYTAQIAMVALMAAAPATDTRPTRNRSNAPPTAIEESGKVEAISSSRGLRLYICLVP